MKIFNFPIMGYGHYQIPQNFIAGGTNVKSEFFKHEFHVMEVYWLICLWVQRLISATNIDVKSTMEIFTAVWDR